MEVPAPRVMRFGVFELDSVVGELRKAGLRIRLPDQSLKILLILLKRPGAVVTREELRHELWHDGTFVAFDHSLNAAINRLRAALGDSAENPHFVETLAHHGYRFIGSVQGFPGAAETGLSPGAAERTGAPSWRKRYGPALAAGAVGLALAGLLLARAVGRSAHRGQSAQRIQSLAVLPLENLSQDPEQEYFADGMTDELITNLAQISALRVISRGSVMAYKGKHVSTAQVARDLNVDALVEGTVLRSGDRVRITAQLVDAKTDRHIWAQTYARDLRDVLALQDEVAQAVAKQIEIKLTPQEQKLLATHRPVDPAAHQAYLRGVYELHGITAEATDDLRLQSVRKAIGFFQQALSQDPNDALAYAGLADAYRSLSTDFKAPLDVMPKAKAAALKAIELDDSIAEAHAALGSVVYAFDWDWLRAEQEFRRALELNPNLAQAHADYGQYLLKVPRRTDEAIQELQRAYALDPLLPLSQGKVAGFLFMARRYTESIAEARKLGSDAREVVLALSYAELGQRDQAVAAANRAVASWRSPVALSQIAAAYALAGEKDKARAERLSSSSAQSGYPAPTHAARTA